MKENDVLTDIKSLDIPVMIIMGEDDYICPIGTAKEWFDNLTAPEKKILVIKNAAHMVNFEQSEKWNEAVKMCIKK